ncbi:MAG TPA: substrate-binding domain-containing protein [Anaeromyxobacteraceae bacterium]
MREIRARVVGGAVVCATVVVLAALGAPAAWAEAPVRINGSGGALDAMKPLMQAWAAEHPAERLRTNPPLGSSGAAMALLAGALDLAVLGRPLLPAEVARGARGRTYGKTPLILVTHASVRKHDITVAELEAIFSGARLTWPNGRPIRVILRPEKDTNTQLLASLSPGMARADAAARKLPWAIIAVTDHEASQMVARTPGAIGAAALSSLHVEELPLNALTLGGVPGTVETLEQGRYPLARDVILVTTARSAPAALSFVEYAFSTRGRALAARNGVLVTGGGR